MLPVGVSDWVLESIEVPGGGGAGSVPWRPATPHPLTALCACVFTIMPTPESLGHGMNPKISQLIRLEALRPAGSSSQARFCDKAEVRGHGVPSLTQQCDQCPAAGSLPLWVAQAVFPRPPVSTLRVEFLSAPHITPFSLFCG